MGQAGGVGARGVLRERLCAMNGKEAGGKEGGERAGVWESRRVEETGRGLECVCVPSRGSEDGAFPSRSFGEL